jgi:Zn-dependent M28 family amino/carboxypeptidase
MKHIKICLLLLAVGLAGKSWSQDLLNTISKAETERIEKYLSSDELEGRKTFSKGIDKAAAFIANEFAQAGLATFKNSGTYLQSFSIMSNKFSKEDTNKIENLTLSNVVAVIPGKSLANEYVIFSGHYDHLGINSARAVNGDSIYNGANDDAAGTTAMIMLSKYFKKLDNNERTLIFAAFTAEEVGGFGAQYFSKQFDPMTVKAMFNIEMIGTESKWGKNSAFITGYEKTDMGAILQKNLAGSGFTFYPDPYTDQNLFYRSDNTTLARLGVAAHTISTSKMDSEPNYHKPSDEFQTLDIDNMNEIIKAIAKSAQTIIAGKDTPTRVDTTQLK